MILSIGEILADIFFNAGDGSMTAKLGGAPFNMAVSAQRSGADVVFFGNVGNDPLGRWLVDEASKYALGGLHVTLDDRHNTTIAMVSRHNGERDFAFLRHFTADYYIYVDLAELDGLHPRILHVGSLMLSTPEGRALADRLYTFAESRGIAISFDVNFRSDIFRSVDRAVSIYRPFIDRADIVKFSKEEAQLFNVYETLCTPDRLVVVTLGEEGAFASFRGVSVTVPTQKVTPVDTTGAGDAFYGAFLAGVESVGRDRLDKDALISILADANKKGAAATQYVGGIAL